MEKHINEESSRDSPFIYQKSLLRRPLFILEEDLEAMKDVTKGIDEVNYDNYIYVRTLV